MEARRKAEEIERKRQEEEDRRAALALQVGYFWFFFIFFFFKPFRSLRNNWRRKHKKIRVIVNNWNKNVVTMSWPCDWPKSQTVKLKIVLRWPESMICF